LQLAILKILGEWLPTSREFSARRNEQAIIFGGRPKGE
jgi:hypothetical protein